MSKQASKKNPRKATRAGIPALQRARVDRILSQFRKKKILVYGDVGVDQYTVGKVTRISPEAPIPIVEVGSVSYKMGLAANVADNVAALGGSPLLVGLVGRDHGARIFRTLLKSMKATDRYLVEDRTRPTTLKERVVAESQQVVRIDHEKKGGVSAAVMKQAEAHLLKAVAEADCVIIEDYAKGLVSAAFCELLVAEAERRSVPVLVDPNSKSPLRIYRGCTLMTPNTAEAEALSGITIDSHAKLQEAGHRLLRELASPFVIITRGRDGMAIFARGEKEPVLIPTFAREVFDVSGAGDTVIATLGLALVSGASVVEAALLANYAAGVEVGKRGTATVSQGELKEYIRVLNEVQGSGVLRF